MKSGTQGVTPYGSRAVDIDDSVEALLRDIETEPVPERLLILARQLQEALAERRKGLGGAPLRSKPATC